MKDILVRIFNILGEKEAFESLEIVFGCIISSVTLIVSAVNLHETKKNNIKIKYIEMVTGARDKWQQDIKMKVGQYFSIIDTIFYMPDECLASKFEELLEVGYSMYITLFDSEEDKEVKKMMDDIQNDVECYVEIKLNKRPVPNDIEGRIMNMSNRLRKAIGEIYKGQWEKEKLEASGK